MSDNDISRMEELLVRNFEQGKNWVQISLILLAFSYFINLIAKIVEYSKGYYTLLWFFNLIPTTSAKAFHIVTGILKTTSSITLGLGVVLLGANFIRMKNLFPEKGELLNILGIVILAKYALSLIVNIILIFYSGLSPSVAEGDLSQLATLEFIFAFIEYFLTVTLVAIALIGFGKVLESQEKHTGYTEMNIIAPFIQLFVMLLLVITFFLYHLIPRGFIALVIFEMVFILTSIGAYLEATIKTSRVKIRNYTH